MAHDLNCVMYTGDSQHYVTFYPSDKARDQKLQLCANYNLVNLKQIKDQ